MRAEYDNTIYVKSGDNRTIGVIRNAMFEPAQRIEFTAKELRQLADMVDKFRIRKVPGE